MIKGLPGKTTSDLYARSPLPVTFLGCASVSVIQVGDTESQSVVFQTPPPSAARYMTFGFVGSGTAVSTRPDITGPENSGDCAIVMGPNWVQLVVLSVGADIGNCRSPENSDVFPAGSVAVAVTQSLVDVDADKLAEKLAVPVASVVTVVEPT